MFKKWQGPDRVHLWSAVFRLEGASLYSMTVTWQPVYRDKVLQATKQLLVQKAQLMSTVADHVLTEINKPLIDKSFPYTYMVLL